MSLFSSDDDAYGSGASWWVSSKKDPRWNASGRCGHSIWLIDEACREHIEKMERTLGKPPDDLEIGGMKD